MDEEVDDGLGSELNTPRDNNICTQTDVSIDTSVEPASLPITSTPRSAGRLFHLLASSSFELDLSAIQEAPVVDTSTSVKRQDDSGDYSALDWAVNVASKQMELLELSGEHDTTRRQMQSMQEVISQLQSRVDSAEATIEGVNWERSDLIAKLEHYKKSSQDNEMTLAKCKDELLIAQTKIDELENICVEVNVDKMVDGDMAAKLVSEKEEYKTQIAQLKRDAQYREQELLREKEALLESANEERRQLAEWRERATRLEQLASNQSSQLKRYEEMEQRFNDILKVLADEREKISELSKELGVQSDNAKKYRDEVLHLRVKLDEMKSASTSVVRKSSPPQDMIRLRNECEQLQHQLEADRGIKAEWTIFKRSNEEMRGRIDKQASELVELRDALSEKRKQLNALEDERTELKRKCAQLEIDLNCVNGDFAAFQNGAEIQYQTEMAQLKEVIREKDERLDRLHTRIAKYESYPGMGSSVFLSDGSSDAADMTVWELMPIELREQFTYLKQQYKELDEVVQKMMQSHIANINESLRSRHSEVMEDKMTDCGGLAQPSDVVQSGHELPAIETASSEEPSSESTVNETVEPPNHVDISTIVCGDDKTRIEGLLNSIHTAKINGKLTRNIKQLLEKLVTDVVWGTDSTELINDAVIRFFTNLDLLLRETLSTSDGNKRRCEELESARSQETEERRVLQDELRAAQDRYAIFEAKAEMLKLQLKDENRKVIELRNQIEQHKQHIQRLDASNTGLKGIVAQQQLEIDEKAAMCRKSAEFLDDFQIELGKMGAYADMLNEKVRQGNREKEDLKRHLNDRDYEVKQLQDRLVESIDQCTLRANDVKKFEERLIAAQMQNDTLKRTCEKRERFLAQMDILLKTMKVRNEALREANRLRQRKVDVILKFLARHGIDVGEGFDMHPQSALNEQPNEKGQNSAVDDMPHDMNEPVEGTAGPVVISEAAVERLVCRLDRIRGNSPFIWVEPAQGFLRSACTQPINVSFDASQPDLLNNSPQLLQVFCRPVTRRTEAICRRWFRAPIENNSQTQQQLAQTLDIGCSDGFVALETILDLPCNALSVQSEPYPTLYADDSDTTTARAIDYDTETACGVSENEIMALLPPDVQAVTARCVMSDMQVMTARGVADLGAETVRGVMSEVTTARAVNQPAGCYWMNRLIDKVFPPEEGKETVPPCGAGR